MTFCLKKNKLIRNYEELASTKLRKEALDIFTCGLQSVFPEWIIPRLIRLESRGLFINDEIYDLSNRNIFIFGGGKASAIMASSIESVLGPSRIKDGIIIDKTVAAKTKKIRVLLGGHPVPNAEGVAAVKEMISLTKSISPNDLIICLISGGGSSLLTSPVSEVPLKELCMLYDHLLHTDMPVSEINIIRKHLTQLSGGRLAKLLYPSTIVSLIISDTLDWTYDATASGPTHPDESTFEMAIKILYKYGLVGNISNNILKYLNKGMRGEVPESIKRGDPIFENVRNIIIADNCIAIERMRDLALSSGYETKIVSSKLTGSISIVAEKLASEIHNHQARNNICLIAGGEPTVDIEAGGKGGRCQHLAALLTEKIKNVPESVFLAAGTDGNDYLLGVGGAIVDYKTSTIAKKMGNEASHYIRDFNTFEYHRKLGNLVLMEPTHTNVCDVFIFLKGYPGQHKISIE